MSTALAGMRILEVSGGMSGSLAGMVLADNGAEVIKVESPAGDPMRESPGFIVWGRGKKSVVLDLKTPEGRDYIVRLAQGADGLIEDFRPGVAERLGIDYETLSVINPGLVHVSITAWGEKGPYRDLPGWEYMVAAKTGRMNSQEGFREGPIFTPTPIASYGAAMLGVQGLLACLYHRQLTGRGQRVRTSLLHALTSYDMGGFQHRMHQNKEAGKVFGVLPLAFMTPLCADGRYLQMCSRQPHLFRNWLRTMGLEHLFDDPAYKDMPDVFPTQEDMAAILEMIEGVMQTRPADEWLDLHSREDVGSDPFLTPEEYLHIPQTIENGRVVEVVDPVVGPTTQIGPIAVFSKTPSEIGAPAPTLGQHTQEVLANLASKNEAKTPATPLVTTNKRYPLEGVTVLEIAYFYAAPFSDTLLAEMGARVIKIEPPAGDPMRRNWSSLYTKSAQGKESIVLDLKTPEGLAIAHQLVAKADIFLHNFRPGVTERLKIDYKTMTDINPKLVYVYGSCYGSNGPWSHRPGFHSTPNAIAGSGIIESGEGNPPRDRTFPDPTGALAVATASMLGLSARERTGMAQYVEATMISSLSYVIAPWNVQYEGKPKVRINDHGQYGFHALTRLYETKEGWLFLMSPTQSEWEKLARSLGLDGLLSDPRFVDKASRLEHDDKLIALIGEALQSRSAGEWEEALIKAGVPATQADASLHPDFMLNHPQIRENGLAIEDDLPDTGKFWRSNACIQFPDMETRIAPPQPLGSHTEAILAELGFSERQMDELNEKGVTTVIGHGLKI
jgi:crotonobetainyl-CoA:carnitine CoA-transferase CaiB-like acyl-CoA transferase